MYYCWKILVSYQIGSKSILNSANLNLKGIVVASGKQWACLNLIPKATKSLASRVSLSSSHLASFCMLALSQTGPLWLTSLP